MTMVGISRLAKAVTVIASGVLAAAILSAVPASAHPASTYYPIEWINNETVCWGFNTGFPTGNWRTRVRAADDVWNAAAGSPAPEFFNCLQDDVSYGSATNPCGISGTDTGAVFWNNLGASGALGITRKCTGSAIWNFTLEFNSAISWYTGTGDAPSSQWDSLSIAVHEFGHVTGFSGHIPEWDASCLENDTRNTMCPGFAAGIGTEYLRTLASHDIHTFDSAY
jgi:hypothetical protein